MPISIPDLSITKTYADGKKLKENQLDAANDSIDTYVETYLRNNLEQLAYDVFGDATYSFYNTGSQSVTNSVYDKQSAESLYAAGNIDIGTVADAGWGAADASNAVIVFTPEKRGKYKATFTFTHSAASAATTEFTCVTSFRITDGADVSAMVNSGGVIPATAAGSGTITNPITISHIFEWTTTSPKTIALHKYNRTMADVDSNVVAASATAGELMMMVEKI